MDYFFIPFLLRMDENDGEKCRVIVLDLCLLALLGFGDDHLVDRAGIQAEDIAAFPVLEEDLRQEVAPFLIQLAADAVLHQLVRVRIGGIEPDGIFIHFIAELIDVSKGLPLDA